MSSVQTFKNNSPIKEQNLILKTQIIEVNHQKENRLLSIITDSEIGTDIRLPIYHQRNKFKKSKNTSTNVTPIISLLNKKKSHKKSLKKYKNFTKNGNKGVKKNKTTSITPDDNGNLKKLKFNFWILKVKRGFLKCVRTKISPEIIHG